MLRVILVDDEPLARLGMRQMLAAHPEIAIAGEAQNVSIAVDLIQREKPDAIFLDVHMPKASGFSLLQRLENPPKIVFVTAHSEHAARAFDVQAVDYLLKPVRPARLADAVSRLTTACAGRGAAPRYALGDRLCLRTPQRTIIAALPDVIALEADGDFTRFHIQNEPSLMICQSLHQYESTLPSPPFLRLGRSLMVNLDRVLRLESLSRDTAQLWMKDYASPFTLGRNARLRLRQNLP